MNHEREEKSPPKSYQDDPLRISAKPNTRPSFGLRLVVGASHTCNSSPSLTKGQTCRTLPTARDHFRATTADTALIHRSMAGYSTRSPHVSGPGAAQSNYKDSQQPCTCCQSDTGVGTHRHSHDGMAQSIWKVLAGEAPPRRLSRESVNT